MSYTQHFSNDLFISYSHADNTEGWIDDFHRKLDSRLVQLGIRVVTWRDQKLNGIDVFSDETFAQLKSSAMLLSIITPNSVRSRWCQDERQKFEQFATLNGGLRMGNTLRTVKVVKTPLNDDAHRSLFGTLGFEFYAKDTLSSRFTEFLSGSPPFTTKLDELAQSLAGALGALRSHSPRPSITAYVAAVTTDLEERRTRVASQLSAWGCVVLPEPSSLSEASSSLRQQIESDIGQSRFSVHVLGPKRGFIPDGENDPVVVMQYRIACEKKLERIAYWSAGMAPHPSIGDVLAADTAANVDRLEERTLDQLLEALETRVRRLSDEPVQDQQEAPNLYLICSETDWPTALELQSCLKGRYGVWLPIRNAAQQRLRLQDHRQTLRRSDGALLYWGRADEAWFRDNLWELLSARTKRRSNRLPALCVSQPPAPDREQYRRPDLRFEQVEQLKCDSLQKLVSSIFVATGKRDE